jgi:endosialidase-like protein
MKNKLIFLIVYMLIVLSLVGIVLGAWTDGGTNLYTTTESVGIGIVNPERDLHIHDTTTSVLAKLSTDDTQDTIIIFSSNDDGGASTEAGVIGIDYDEKVFRINYDTAFGNTHKGIEIDSSGNVGVSGTLTTSGFSCSGCIGTTEVSGLGSADISGLTDADITFDLQDAVDDGGCTNCITDTMVSDTLTASSATTASGLICTDCVDGNDLADDITLDNDLNIDSGKFFIDSNNRQVGINTTSPSHELNVVGSANITGNLYIGKDFSALGQFTGSSKTLKKDIQKLSKRDYEKILRQINGLDLVKFRYKNQNDNERKTVGVIAENSPRDILASNGLSVNTISFASYSIGAIKAQQKQIEELKQEKYSENYDLKQELNLKQKQIDEQQSQISELIGRMKKIEIKLKDNE